jgi:hypothetical protein
MPKRTSKPKRPKRPKDINQLAHELVRQSTEETFSASDISRVMREMGHRGGEKGGKRRLETMTAEQRNEIALGAARARWAKEKKGK